MHSTAETQGLENVLKASPKLTLLFGTTLPSSLGLVSSTENFESFHIGTNCKQMGACNFYLRIINELMQGRQLLLSQGKKDFPVFQCRETKQCHVHSSVPGRNIFHHHSISAGWVVAFTWQNTHSGSPGNIETGNPSQGGCKVRYSLLPLSLHRIRVFCFAWQWLQMPMQMLFLSGPNLNTLSIAKSIFQRVAYVILKLFMGSTQVC